jgi:hypothetical protein
VGSVYGLIVILLILILVILAIIRKFSKDVQGFIKIIDFNLIDTLEFFSLLNRTQLNMSLRNPESKFGSIEPNSKKHQNIEKVRFVLINEENSKFHCTWNLRKKFV